MPVEVDVRVSRAMQGRLLQAADRAVGTLTQTMLLGAVLVQGEITLAVVQSMSTKRPKIDRGHGRTGNLARSWKPTPLQEGAGGTVSVSVVSDVVYARIQDEGGRVFPKRQYLAVPLEGRTGSLWPRDMGRDALFPSRTKGGGLVLRDVTDGVPLYSLRRFVDIPAKNYIAAAVKSSRPKLALVFGERMVAAVRKAIEDR